LIEILVVTITGIICFFIMTNYIHSTSESVVVSGLEMTQNSIRLSWSADQVINKLEDIMTDIYHSCVDASESYGLGYDLIAGANIAAFTRLAKAMVEQGSY